MARWSPTAGGSAPAAADYTPLMQALSMGFQQYGQARAGKRQDRQDALQEAIVKANNEQRGVENARNAARDVAEGKSRALADQSAVLGIQEHATAQGFVPSARTGANQTSNFQGSSGIEGAVARALAAAPQRTMQAPTLGGGSETLTYDPTQTKDARDEMRDTTRVAGQEAFQRETMRGQQTFADAQNDKNFKQQAALTRLTASLQHSAPTVVMGQDGYPYQVNPATRTFQRMELQGAPGATHAAPMAPPIPPSAPLDNLSAGLHLPGPPAPPSAPSAPAALAAIANRVSPSPGARGPFGPPKEATPIPDAAVQVFANNAVSLQQIDDAIKTLEGGGGEGHIGPRRMIMPNMLSQVTDPEGNTLRGTIAGIGNVKYHDLSGGAVSAAEDKRMQVDVPRVDDPPDAALAKLRRLRGTFAGKDQLLREYYSPERGYRAPPSATVPGAGSAETGSSFPDFTAWKKAKGLP